MIAVSREASTRVGTYWARADLISWGEERKIFSGDRMSAQPTLYRSRPIVGEGRDFFFHYRVRFPIAEYFHSANAIGNRQSDPQ